LLKVALKGKRGDMKEKQRDEFNQSVLNAYMAISH
jgi:hypothetical protein